VQSAHTIKEKLKYFRQRAIDAENSDEDFKFIEWFIKEKPSLNM